MNPTGQPQRFPVTSFVHELLQNEAKQREFNAAPPERRKEMAREAGVPEQHLQAFADANVGDINSASRRELEKSGVTMSITQEYRIFQPPPRP